MTSYLCATAKRINRNLNLINKDFNVNEVTLGLKKSQIPSEYYILDEDNNVITTVKHGIEKEILAQELKRIKEEELYVIKQVKDSGETIDIGFDEGCLLDLIICVEIGDLVFHKRERYPNGKHHHVLEFEFENGSKARWDIYEQETPVSIKELI
ncbi:hypothetical protein [Orenia marismortui]|uniref:hypothetical protein n=1 Tax=Orenia marismortui TaxID=46469 RepID=UPI00035C94BC|nr:hypothetical protein [Orenia marismortui]